MRNRQRSLMSCLHPGCDIVASQPRCWMCQVTRPLSVLQRRVDNEAQPVIGTALGYGVGFPGCARLRRKWGAADLLPNAISEPDDR